MQTLANAMAIGYSGEKLAQVHKIVKPFDGTSLDPTATTKWIISTKRAFQEHDVPNGKNAAYASILLQDEAYNQWISQRQLMEDPVTCERFKEVFLDHQFPTCVEEFYQFKQKGRSIQEYKTFVGY